MRSADNTSSSERMRRVGSRDTAPEKIVRSACHAMGFRFRLHVRGLPGTPDIVFPRLGKIIFVHGCFWHRHGGGCRRASMPKTNVAFWEKKFARNQARDRQNVRQLRRVGWKVAIVWECQTTDLGALERRLSAFLGG